MPDEIRKAVDERAEWIDAACEAAIERGPQALSDAIQALDDEHYRSMLYMLLLARANDLEQLRELARDQVAREQFKGLDGDDDVILH
jgi:hypothetical protein